MVIVRTFYILKKNIINKQHKYTSKNGFAQHTVLILQGI